MKPLKHIVLFYLLIAGYATAFAQQETFDIITYTRPSGWQKQQVDGGIQLFVTDNKTGGYAIAVVTKAMASAGTAADDFKSQWKSLLINTVSSITEPVMTAPVQDNGWEILSGNGNYVDGTMKGLATLITATGYNQTTAVVLMTNTQHYQNDLLTFINSLDLKKPVQKESTVPAPTSGSNGAASASSLVGLWCDYQTESSGFMNGMPMLTGGYFRKEYRFHPDGTYVFRVKNWSVNMKEILFVHETGKWVVNGSQLTITPTKGTGEWWSKSASNRTSEWGSRIKASTWKLESVTYTFDLHYFSGVKETHLLLQGSTSTERDGRSSDNGQVNHWSYTPRALDKSLIDNPPGFKAGLSVK